MACQPCQIAGHTDPLQLLHMLPQGPAIRDRVIAKAAKASAGAAPLWRERCRAVPAVPHDLCSHALTDRALTVRVRPDRDIRMAVGVDEPGTDGQPLGTDCLLCRLFDTAVHGYDASSTDSHITAPPRVPGTIHHPAAADQDIQHDTYLLYLFSFTLSPHQM